jgi:hypothetical protein
MSNLHRQTGGDLMHLRRTSGTETRTSAGLDLRAKMPGQRESVAGFTSHPAQTHIGKRPTRQRSRLGRGPIPILISVCGHSADITRAAKTALRSAIQVSDYVALFGDPSRIRTCNPRSRNPLPAAAFEQRRHWVFETSAAKNLSDASGPERRPVGFNSRPALSRYR